MKKLLFAIVMIFSLLATGALAAIDLTATSEPVTLSTDPGSSLNGQVTVHNSESVDHTVTFSGYSLTHSSDSSKQLNINSISDVTVTTGSNQAVNYAITSTNVYAGTYQGALTGTSTTNSALSDNVQFQVTVNQNPSASATSATFSAGRGIARTADNAFSISNTGNTDLSSISVTVGDLSDGTNTLSNSYISFNLDSNSINYGDGAVQVDVNTNIPENQLTGIYTGTITVNYGSGQTTAPISVTVRDPVHDVEAGDEINIGDEAQARNEQIQHTFNVENKGDHAETVDLALSGVSTKYNAQLSTTQFNLQPGQIQQVVLTLDIPDDQDSGIQTIGRVQLTYNQATENVPIKLETETKLEITKIEVDVNGDSEGDLTSDGDTLSHEIKPGDDVEFDVFVKNTYSDSIENDDDFKIEDIEITLEPADDEFDEENTDGSLSLKVDKENNEKISFKVPDKIDEGDYDFDVTVEGQEDESGATHTVTWTVTLTVEKDKHDIRISEARLGTSTLKCLRSTELRVTIGNFGSEDEEKAALVILAPDLGINENIMNIELDEDQDESENEFTKTVSINLDDDFAAGSYPITIKLFRNNDNEVEQKILNLKVENCPAPAPEEPVDNTEVVITPPAGSTQDNGASTTPSTTDVVETVESSFTNSTAFIMILAGINLVVLLGILVLVFKFLI